MTLIFHLLKSIESFTGSVISSRITAFTLHIYGCFQSFLLQVPTTKDPSKEGSSLLTSSLGVRNGESGEEEREEYNTGFMGREWTFSEWKREAKEQGNGKMDMKLLRNHSLKTKGNSRYDIRKKA